MSLVKMVSGTPGTVLWSVKVWDAVNNAYGLAGTGGITMDGSNQVYSCMVISNAASTNVQTLLMKFNSNSGALVNSVDMQTLTAVDCNLFFYSTSTRILLGIVLSTGTTELLNFNVAGTALTLSTTLPRLRVVTTGYKQTALGRMLLQGSTVWMIFPSISTAATPLTSLFTVKLTDVTNMNWDADEGCPSVL